MLKAYVSRWKEWEKSEESKIDYWFAAHAENAAYWKTREEAESNCPIFDYHHIAISSPSCGTHICSDFKVEERAPNEFVVFCLWPDFIVETSGTATVVNTCWLHIHENKSPQSGMPSTYMLARANAPSRNFAGGSMPTVHYNSWEQLSRKLSEVGIHEDALQEAKEELDSKGSHTITEVILSDKQVKDLGFTDVAA